MADNTYEARVGESVEGWLCYPSYYPGEGDTAPGPTLFLGDRPQGFGYARLKKVRCVILEDHGHPSLHKKVVKT